MFRLATLGGLSLGNSAAADVAIPRRRLALLALLAAAGDRGLSRDKLVAYFWPDSAAEDARHSLEQLLYSLRQQVHGSVFRGSDPLCLNPEVITSDVAVFEAALARGADDEAVCAYTGDFLDGFYINRATEFERWADDQRARLRMAYGAALERIAERATQRNDRTAAVAAWRRRVELDQLNTHSVLGLVRTMAAAGDHAEALRTGTAFEALVREELGVPLDPALAGFLQKLRGSRPDDSATSTAKPREPEAGPHQEPPDSPTTTGVAERRGSVPTTPRHRRARAAYPLIALPIIVGAVWLALPSRPTKPRVAVEVFENWTGDPALDVVGTMTAEYTRNALARTAMLDVADPAFDIWDSRNARRGRPSVLTALVRLTEPQIVISGAYFKKGDSLSFTGKAVDTKSGTILFAFDSVSAKELGDVIEKVRQDVMSGIATHVDPALEAWAGNEGKPPVKFAAYQEFAYGMTAFVNGIVEQKESSRGALGFGSARDHLERAFRLDSTYYIAALWWFWARRNGGDRLGADSVLALVRPHEAAMSPYELALYRYNVAMLHGTPQQRYELDEQLVGFAPASEYRICLGRDAVQAGHPREALSVLESLDSTYSWMRLIPPAPGFRVRALVQLGKYERAIAAARQNSARAPDDLTSTFPEIDALVALGRLDEAEEVVKRSADRGGSFVSGLPNLMLYAGLRLQAASRAESAHRLFSRALAFYTREPTNAEARDPMLFGKGRSLYYLGQWDDARAAFVQLTSAPLGTTPYDWRALIFLGSLAARRSDEAEVERIRGVLNGPTVNRAEAQYFEARVAAIRGQSERSLEFLAEAVRLGAHVWEVMDEGDAAPSMDPDFAGLRGSARFRKAVGFW